MSRTLDESLSRWRPLSEAAFYLALIVALCRATLLQYLRDPSPVLPMEPGSVVPPFPTGPAVSGWLDVLCLLSAMLVLARWTFDTSFKLRASLWTLPMVGLGGLAMASVFWANDAYAAWVGGSQWLAAAAVVFTLSQTVRDWVRLRLCLGFAAGLLVANVVAGLWYFLLDHPAVVEDFETNLAQRLRERGIEPGTPQAEQMAGRVRRGDFGGFAFSPNSFAVALVSTTVVLAGLAGQRWKDNSQRPLAILLLIPVLPAIYLLTRTGGKAAIAAGLLVGLLFVAGYRFRGLIDKRRSLLFAGIAGAIVLGAVGVIALGVVRGGLPSASLNFRWMYWVASLQVFLDQPLLGTGFSSFGAYYLEHRLPAAAEEISDPHNFVIRFATELGVAGLLLSIAFIGALAWHLTRPATEPAKGKSKPIGPRAIVIVSAVALVLHIASSVDLSSPAAAYDIIRLAILFACLGATALLSTVASTEQLEVMTKPANLALAVAGGSVAVFMLHGFSDIALFEPSTLFTFAVLLGSAGAMRGDGRSAKAPVKLAAIAGAGLVALVVVAMTALVTGAELKAKQGKSDIFTRRITAGVNSLAEAAEDLPFGNALWLRQAGQLEAKESRRLDLFRRAAQLEPRSTGPLFDLARAEAELSPAEALPQFEKLVAIDPRSSAARLAYADALEAADQPAEAAEQLRAALAINDALAPDEMERMSNATRGEIEARIARLESK